MLQYPDTIQSSFKTQEPMTLLTYLFHHAHALGSSFDVLWVVGSEREVMKARLALFSAAKIVLGSGMRLLGLEPLERM